MAYSAKLCEMVCARGLMGGFKLVSVVSRQHYCCSTRTFSIVKGNVWHGYKRESLSHLSLLQKLCFLHKSHSTLIASNFPKPSSLLQRHNNYDELDQPVQVYKGKSISHKQSLHLSSASCYYSTLANKDQLEIHSNKCNKRRFKSSFGSGQLDETTKSTKNVEEMDKSEETQTKRENIKTIPNLLTTLRMASAPLLSYLVINDQFGYAFSVFVLAGLSDMVDGYIARNFKNQRTAFGTALDPLADKFLISFLTVSLTISGLIPVPVTALILSRDAGLVVASFYIRYISLAPPRTLSRYFDFSHVTAKIYPSAISKINTAFQFSYVAFTLAAPVFDFVESPWLQLLMYTTAATTFLSGADYMLTWRRRLKIIKNT